MSHFTDTLLSDDPALKFCTCCGIEKDDNGLDLCDTCEVDAEEEASVLDADARAYDHWGLYDEPSLEEDFLDIGRYW